MTVGLTRSFYEHWPVEVRLNLIERRPSQDPFPFGDADDGLRAGIEFQKILFDSVAENHAVLRHAGFKDQRRFRSHASEHQRRARGLGWEWFADGVEQVVRIPGEFGLVVQ